MINDALMTNGMAKKNLGTAVQYVHPLSRPPPPLSPRLRVLSVLPPEGAMIGSIICFKVGDGLGRRRELLIAAVLFFCGAIIEAASGSSVWSGDWGLVVLMTGRISYGIGCGFAMHGVSGECANSMYNKYLRNFYVCREAGLSTISRWRPVKVSADYYWSCGYRLVCL